MNSIEAISTFLEVEIFCICKLILLLLFPEEGNFVCDKQTIAPDI